MVTAEVTARLLVPEESMVAVVCLKARLSHLDAPVDPDVCSCVAGLVPGTSSLLVEVRSTGSRASSQ